MDYARIESSGRLIRAADAVRGTRFVCPTCGHPVELRRGQDLEYFAHWRGLEGTRECDLFVPGAEGGSGGGSLLRDPDTHVEDDPSELGLVLDQLGNEWGLGIRIPEIPNDELGNVSLAELRSAQVQVASGLRVLARVSALDLRPGVGAARVTVPPSLQQYRVRPMGTWPRPIDSGCWNLECRGLAATGDFFRLRRGEWTRLFAGSALHHGERLLVFADTRSAPPQAIVREVHAQVSSGGLDWRIWEVELPSAAPDGAVAAWLMRSGHSLVPRLWGVTLVTPARAYGESGTPIFWLGDLPLLELETPMPATEALATVNHGATSLTRELRSTIDRTLRILLEPLSAGQMHFRVTADRGISFDCVFSERPPRATVIELLARTPRLRVWLGEECLEPWPVRRHTVRLRAHESPDLRVDLGGDSERARVTVWERGRQRTYRGLSAREVESSLGSALATSSLIEIDADNRGRIELVPSVVPTAAAGKSARPDRLAWRAHAQSVLRRPGATTVASIVRLPRSMSRFVVRAMDVPALIHTRVALRKRTRTGGGSP